MKIREIKLVGIRREFNTPHFDHHHFLVDNVYHHSLLMRMQHKYCVAYLKFHGAKLLQFVMLGNVKCLPSLKLRRMMNKEIP